MENTPNKLIEKIAKVGRGAENVIAGWGQIARLFVEIILESKSCIKRPQLILNEIYASGFLSLVIIIVSGLFIGMVLGFQGYNTLKRYGSEAVLGSLVSLSLLRELGPVVTALLFAGRAGSSLTAEIGQMRATEQLEAMEVMAVSPIARVVAPRFWGGFISLPLLAAIFTAVGIWGGKLVGVDLLGVDAGTYWSQMRDSVGVDDLLNGLTKSLVFAVLVTLISVYKGFYAKPTVEGVARATTQSVVISSLAVLGFDFVLTAFMF